MDLTITIVAVLVGIYWIATELMDRWCTSREEIALLEAVKLHGWPDGVEDGDD
jgi:hypothetical protein